MLTPEIMLATNNVIEAARCVVNSYRATGGYTLPLSINLDRLSRAYAALDLAAYRESRLKAGLPLGEDDVERLWGRPEPPEGTPLRGPGIAAI